MDEKKPGRLVWDGVSMTFAAYTAEQIKFIKLHNPGNTDIITRGREILFDGTTVINWIFDTEG